MQIDHLSYPHSQSDFNRLTLTKTRNGKVDNIRGTSLCEGKVCHSLDAFTKISKGAGMYKLIDTETINHEMYQAFNQNVTVEDGKIYHVDDAISAVFEAAPEVKLPYAHHSVLIRLLTDIRESLEEECGDRCNPEYNPCWARSFIQRIDEELEKPKSAHTASRNIIERIQNLDVASGNDKYNDGYNRALEDVLEILGEGNDYAT